jgi:nitronate monooxygenase
MNRLCALFGLDVPIIQAPTSSIAGPELAAAVSAAGALGGMGLTWTAPTDAAERVRQVRAATGRAFFVNFALAFDPVPLPAVLEAGAPVITFSFGDPEAHLGIVRAAGAKVGLQVGTAAGAARAVELGLDFVICQGVEAGGHVQSSTALDALLPQVLRAVAGRVPVVAAGGIATGADIARVLAQGADGAMLGTRFVATQESRAHPEYKRRLVEAPHGQTALTTCFDGGWPQMPHRVLRNATLERWEAAGCPQTGQRPGEGDEVARDERGAPIRRYEDTAPRAGMSGDIAAMCLYAGIGVDRVTDIPTAAELVCRLRDEASMPAPAVARPDDW